MRALILVAALLFQLPIPDGEGAWTISITTGGGYTGQGRGSAVLTSLGLFNGNRLAADKAQPLMQLAASLKPTDWAKPLASVPTPTICFDCYTTTVWMSRREAGEVKTYTISWGHLTQRSEPPPDLVRFVEMALKASK